MPFSLSLEGIGYGYNGVPVFSDITLDVPSGDILVITGRSGSGKSTILEICAGLKMPHSGNVFWNGRAFNSLSRTQIQQVRMTTGYVFQPHALISNFPVFENVALPLRYHTQMDDAVLRKRVAAHLELFNIAHIAGKRPEALSVGQCRLASIARAFVMSPEVVFLDEPLSGLDPQTAKIVTDILKRMARYNDVTLVIVSHEADFIRDMQCRVAFLENGTVSMHSSSDLLADSSNTSILSNYFEART